MCQFPKEYGGSRCFSSVRLLTSGGIELISDVLSFTRRVKDKVASLEAFVGNRIFLLMERNMSVLGDLQN